MVSPNPPSIDMLNVWVASTKHFEIHDKVGVRVYDDCYKLSYEEREVRTSIGDLDQFSDESKVKYLCDTIDNFDYEPGYIYRIEATHHYLGDKYQGTTLDKVLLKEKDRYYVKVEELTMIVGPAKTKSTAWTGQEIECLSVQYGMYDKSKEWQAHCRGIGGFEYEPGNMYTLKIERTYMSQFELEMTADAPSSSDMLLTVMSKKAM